MTSGWWWFPLDLPKEMPGDQKQTRRLAAAESALKRRKYAKAARFVLNQRGSNPMKLGDKVHQWTLETIHDGTSYLGLLADDWWSLVQFEQYEQAPIFFQEGFITDNMTFPSLENPVTSLEGDKRIVDLGRESKTVPEQLWQMSQEERAVITDRRVFLEYSKATMNFQRNYSYRRKLYGYENVHKNTQAVIELCDFRETLGHRLVLKNLQKVREKIPMQVGYAHIEAMRCSTLGNIPPTIMANEIRKSGMEYVLLAYVTFLQQGIDDMYTLGLKGERHRVPMIKIPIKPTIMQQSLTTARRGVNLAIRQENPINKKMGIGQKSSGMAKEKGEAKGEAKATEKDKDIATQAKKVRGSKEYKELQKDLESTTAQLSGAHGRINEVEKQTQAAEEKFQQKTEAYESLLKKSAKDTDEAKGYLKSLQDKEQEVKQLRDKHIQELEEQARRYKALKDGYAVIDIQYKTAVDGAKKFQEQIETLQGKATRTEDERNSLQGELDQIRKERAAQAIKVRDLEIQYNELAHEMQLSVKSARDHSETEKKGFHERINVLEAQVSAANQKIQDAQEYASGFARARDTLAEERDHSEAEKKIFQERISELEAQVSAEEQKAQAAQEHASNIERARDTLAEDRDAQDAVNRHLRQRYDRAARGQRYATGALIMAAVGYVAVPKMWQGLKQWCGPSALRALEYAAVKLTVASEKLTVASGKLSQALNTDVPDTPTVNTQIQALPTSDIAMTF